MIDIVRIIGTFKGLEKLNYYEKTKKNSNSQCTEVVQQLFDTSESLCPGLLVYSADIMIEGLVALPICMLCTHCVTCVSTIMVHIHTINGLVPFLTRSYFNPLPDPTNAFCHLDQSLVVTIEYEDISSLWTIPKFDTSFFQALKLHATIIKLVKPDKDEQHLQKQMRCKNAPKKKHFQVFY